MTDKDSLTFILGKDYIAITRGSNSHSELISYVYAIILKNENWQGVHFSGNKKQFLLDLKSANMGSGNIVTHEVGILHGRAWVNSGIVEFWDTKQKLQQHNSLIDTLFNFLNQSRTEFKIRYQDTQGEGDRHVKNIGTMYLTKDNPKLKTPEDKRFEYLLKKNLREIIINL